eukprot:gene4676-33953_t
MTDLYCLLSSEQVASFSTSKTKSERVKTTAGTKLVDSSTRRRPALILKAKANANANVKANGKHAGQAGFIYTVHPWVVQLFFDCNEKHLPGFPHVNRSDALRCPTSEQVADFRKALEDGDAVMQ